MAVTDHDTLAAWPAVRTAAGSHGIRAIPGIEVSAIESGRDVHILGYFMDPSHRELADFLLLQRQRRVARVTAMAGRLAALGVPIDVAALVEETSREGGRSIGRPQVARAMIAAGHVRDVGEAFDTWLGFDRPGFVVREGPSVEEAIGMLHRAGGVASIAHPGKTAIDSRLPALRSAGLDGIEVYHADHDAAQRAHYARMASDLGCLVTGGSDFHGDPKHGREPGSSPLPLAEWARLEAAADHHG
jgi:predicted metal-dependent phosphoesterase TrpH